jgi:hypothetical protein
MVGRESEKEHLNVEEISGGLHGECCNVLRPEVGWGAVRGSVVLPVPGAIFCSTIRDNRGRHEGVSHSED